MRTHPLQVFRAAHPRRPLRRTSPARLPPVARIGAAVYTPGMASTLIAVITALLLGHLFPAGVRAMRHHAWFAAWVRWLDARFTDPHSVWHGRWGVLIAVLPPLALVAVVQVLLHTPLAGVLGLLFAVAVLVYAWGPRDLDQDVADVADADSVDARRAAAARLGIADGRSEGGPVIGAVFRSALRRWFGPLLWFLLLGAAGALLYRLLALAAEAVPRPRGGDADVHDAGVHGDASPVHDDGRDDVLTLPAATRDGARALLALLEWPVAQLMTFSLALVGNFDTVVGAWKDAGGAALHRGIAFLDAAARASVRSEIAEEAREWIDEGDSPGAAWARLGELPELRDAMSLVWRILLLWLAVLALFVIAGWVG